MLGAARLFYLARSTQRAILSILRGKKAGVRRRKRKKYRQCSSVVWLSKKSTRKLYIVRLLKHRRMVAPGDYINHKLQPVRKGSYTGLARGLAPRKTYKRYFRNKTSK